MEQNKDQSGAAVRGEAVALTDADIVEIARVAHADGRLGWLGFDKDNKDEHTVPTLSKCHFQLVRAVLAKVSARAADALDSQPTRPCQADSPSLEFRTLLEQCRMALADAVWRSTPPIAVLRKLYEQIDKALASSQPSEPASESRDSILGKVICLLSDEASEWSNEDQPIFDRCIERILNLKLQPTDGGGAQWLI